jgi:hypothetical protein
VNKHVEFLVKLRDAHQTIADATNQYIESLAPPEINSESTAVHEENFTTLKFETQHGAKLGDYEIAHKASNLEDKWLSAYSILRNNNATIKDRYHGQDYQYSYWLYGEDMIFRQKLKPKTPKT